ncbi:hypothetical protein A2U01_0047340, partial [Trifolium medium]|nr:hypothetical protein [Trifolium medium]
SLVDDLRGYSWRLSWPEAHFLRSLLRLREELVDRAPVISSVGGVEQRYHKAKSAIFDQSWFVEESIRMHENTLAAYFHEEEVCDARVLELRNELAKLKEQKKEIQLGIREDVGNLLKRRKIQLELKSKVANLGGTLERLMEDLDVVKACKLNIESMCYEVEEAAKFL